MAMLKPILRSSGLTYRYISTTSILQDENWLNKLFVRRIEPTKESHSSLLSDKEIIFTLYTHNVKPGKMDKYLVNCEKLVQLMRSLQKQIEIEQVGSWTVEVGDMDQALHLFSFKGGYAGVDTARKFLDENKDYQKLVKEESEFLRARHLQFLLPFSYWPKIESRSGRNVYEIRSYTLKPGTMIEWGNNWARGIKFRRNTSPDPAFAGYKNLQARKEIRESAWRSPGWDECVAYTVPLIQQMQSRLLLPTSFSPTK